MAGSLWKAVTVVLLVAASASELLEEDNTAHNFEDPALVSELLRRVRSAPRVKRVIGGSSYNLGQWPWLVALSGQIPASSWGPFTTSYQNIYCGGALVACNWVLTAAHCFAVPGAPAGITTPKYWTIMAGSTSRTVTGLLDQLRQFWTSLTGAQTANWFNIAATKIVSHPGYDANNMWLNDIALVKLSKCLPLAPSDPDIALLPLPTNVPSGWPPAQANCSMQGWGCTVMGGPLQQYAQSVTLPVIDPKLCVNVYGNAELDPTRLCAGYNLMHIGICKGDSGGPLVCFNGSSYVQAGIASFADGTDSGQSPGGFTRVVPYVPWIQSVIAAN